MKKSLLLNVLLLACLFVNVQALSAQTYSDANDNLTLPFKPTTIVDGKFAEDTQWYAVRMTSGKYWTAKADTINCEANLSELGNENHFCFVGNNVEGFRIYNRACGANVCYSYATSVSYARVALTNAKGEEEVNGFKLCANGTGYSFYACGVPTACLNDLKASGMLGIWNHGLAAGDVGSRLVFEPISIDKGEGQEDGVPFCRTTISKNSFAPDTHWYTITIRGNKMLEARGDEVLCKPTDVVTKRNLWCFVGSISTGYVLYNYAYDIDKVAYLASSADGTKMTMADPYIVGDSRIRLRTTDKGYVMYYPGNETACINDFASKGKVAIWEHPNSAKDDGSTLAFKEFDLNQLGEDTEEAVPSPIHGEIKYVYMKDGSVKGFPMCFIANYIETPVSADNNTIKSITFKDVKGGIHNFDMNYVERVSNVAPKTPVFESFKFNNKYNDMLIVDADGEITSDNVINVSVGGIGKRLVASFKTSDENAKVYIGSQLQESKKTSHRFTEPLTYMVALPNNMMLRKMSNSKMEWHPIGTEYVVNVKYLSDAPTTEYGIPVINITTNDHEAILSKEDFKSATISIDGAGYLPNMEKTAIQIRGRGHSSWAANENHKNSYRFKFAEKQKPLGMKAGKNWVLVSNANIGALTANIISSRVAEMVQNDGASHHIPVELYINGEFRGQYTLTEKVGIGNNSIEVEDEKKAAMIELDSYFDTEYKFRTLSFNLPATIVEPNFQKDKDLKMESVDVRARFTNFVDAVFDGKDLSAYADLNSVARFLMVNDLIHNAEIMHPKSFYFYNADITDNKSLWHCGPVWDSDWAYGYQATRKYFYDDIAADFYDFSSPYYTGSTFVNKLRYSGEAMNKAYYLAWSDFMVHIGELIEYLDDYHALVAPSYKHNQSKWPAAVASYDKIVSNSKSWLKNRANYVYDYLSNTLGYADKGYLDDTAIDDVISVPARDVKGVYDLSGRRVNDDVNSLPKGIYIVNGRKVVKN